MSDSLFAGVQMAPPDPILGLNEAFRKETNPKKVNLGVGVYLNGQGVNAVLRAVKAAEKKMVETEQTKNYLSIEGSPEYGQATQTLLFGQDSAVVKEGRVFTMHAPGGTGALRLGGDLIKRLVPGATVWVSDPTWPNHNGVFAAAGLAVKSYPYFDAANNRLKLDELLAAINQMAAGDVLLLHACCHNPTGIDPTAGQWKAIVQAAVQRGLIAFLDFAYQGFGHGTEEDALSVRLFAQAGVPLLVASSYSKNFGLYRERTGALTLVLKDSGEAARVLSQAKQVARVNYSNPPSHGGQVVATIMGDPQLKTMWLEELTEMRQRIAVMRAKFVQTLKDNGVSQDFSFLTGQLGMFSFSGIKKEQVLKLRADYGIYMVENGRINVAGMTDGNIGYLCGAIAKVLKG